MALRPFQIGTLADWFGVGLLGGIRESQKCGAQGVQLYAAGELDPLTITAAALEEVKRTLKECNQTVTALCGEVGGYGLEIAADNAAKVAYLKKTLDLALELGSNVVTTHAGVIPADTTDPVYAVLKAACTELGAYAEARGAYYAFETGPEKIPTLCAFIDALGSKGIAVNYDPANLIMVTGDDEVQGVYTAAHRIVHTHAKDGCCNNVISAKDFYKIFAEGGIEAINEGNYSSETPLGKGSVRWREYLQALKDIGYTGFLTIEREVGKDATADIRMAVDFLNDAMDQME